MVQVLGVAVVEEHKAGPVAGVSRLAVMVAEGNKLVEVAVRKERELAEVVARKERELCTSYRTGGSSMR
jgi:hypothetical protein